MGWSALGVVSSLLVIGAPIPAGGVESTSSIAPISSVNSGAAFTIEALDQGNVVELAGPDRASTRATATQKILAENDIGRTILTNPHDKSEAIAGLEFFEGSTASTPAMWAATDEFVDLSWSPLDGALFYQVFRDDKLIISTSDTTFRDIETPAGSAVNYRIETVFTSPDSGGGIWGLVVETPLGESEEPLASQAAAMVTASSSYKSATIQHQTFIPQSRIDAPKVGCTYKGSAYAYGGDGRSYGPSRYPYRTRVQA